MQTPAVVPIPHVGGPIVGPGVPNVLIEGIPAAVVGDLCICVGPPAAIANGSTGVLIAGRAAARLGDPTAHGGSIVGPGAATVMIGEMGSGNAKSVVSAPVSGTKDKGSAADGTKASWIEIQMNDRGGFGVANTKFRLETSSGKIIEGVTDGNGLARVEGIDPGSYKVTFPDLPPDGWKKQ